MLVLKDLSFVYTPSIPQHGPGTELPEEEPGSAQFSSGFASYPSSLRLHGLKSSR